MRVQVLFHAINFKRFQSISVYNRNVEESDAALLLEASLQRELLRVKLGQMKN